MKKSIIIFIHTSFWGCYFLLLFVIIASANAFSNGINTIQILKLVVGFAVVPSLIVFYVFYFFLFPKYLKNKQITPVFIYGILIAIGAALVGSLLLSSLFGQNFMFKDGFNSFFAEIITIFLVSVICGAISLIIKGFITWYDEIKLKEALNLRNYEMQLALIKAQLDPHFLFNTINNIDMLLLKNATQASEYLNKLADILRFMLFETKLDKILLSKEIEYIKKYIELHKIRTSNPDFVNFFITENTKNKIIAPMIFIPFIENAFKHTTNRKNKNAINISLITENESIKFICENICEQKYDNQNTSLVESSGLGNLLIEKRLKLIYSEKHTLQITNKNNIYSVHLTIFN